jgi:O-antigen/teichoic acid export membrane protein
LLTFPLSIVNSVYSAYQDGFLWYIWTSVGNVLSLFSLIIVSRFHGGLPLLIMAIAGTRIVVSLANAGYMFFYQYPFLKPALSAVRWTCVRNLFSLGSRYTIGQLGNLAIYQSQPMIITQFLGPAQAATFIIAQKIITLPTDLVYIATAPFVSAFGEARARGDWVWIRAAFKNTLILSVVLSAVVQIVVALVARRVILSLAGPALVPALSVILWLSVYSFVEAAMHPVYQLLCGLERANILALSLSVCAVVMVGLSIVSAYWWGLAGVAAAMAAAKLFTATPIQLHEMRRIFGRAGPVNDEAAELAL